VPSPRFHDRVAIAFCYDVRFGMAAFDDKKQDSNALLHMFQPVANALVEDASVMPFAGHMTDGYYEGSGNASPAQLHAAFGHWAEDHPAPSESPTKSIAKAFALPVDALVTGGMMAKYHAFDQDDKHEESVVQRLAAMHVASGYAPPVPEQLPDEKKQLDLSTPEARIAAMNQLVQNQSKYDDDGKVKLDETGERTCAASSLVAAAVLGQGTDGLKKLMDGMDANAADTKAREVLDKGDLGAIRAKIEKHEALTNHDLHTLQADLYGELNDKQTAGMSDDEKKKHSGVAPETIDAFLANSKGMDDLMRENHMGISTIDMLGNGHAHAVLSIRNGGSPNGDASATNTTVYDPNFRKDGQIVTDSKDLLAYQLAEKHKKDGSSGFSQ
jgi:hypothetical protein